MKSGSIQNNLHRLARYMSFLRIIKFKALDFSVESLKWTVHNSVAASIVSSG